MPCPVLIQTEIPSRVRHRLIASRVLAPVDGPINSHDALSRLTRGWLQVFDDIPVAPPANAAAPPPPAPPAPRVASSKAPLAVPLFLSPVSDTH
eukprot:3835893-Rhodomonas_salina.6